MRFIEETIKGVVTDVLDGKVSVKTELNTVINWRNDRGLKLGERVVILYDFERDRVRAVVSEAKMSEHAEEVERGDPFLSADEEIDYECIFDLIEGRELNG